MTRIHGAGLRGAERLGAVVLGLGFLTGFAGAADFRSTADAATLLYDGPSAKANPQYVLGRDVPLEVIVAVENWIKVRDVGGTIGWVEKRSLVDRRTLVVRVPLAEVRAAPEDSAPLVFRAEQNVLLELAEPPVSKAHVDLSFRPIGLLRQTLLESLNTASVIASVASSVCSGIAASVAFSTRSAACSVMRAT